MDESSANKIVGIKSLRTLFVIVGVIIFSFATVGLAVLFQPKADEADACQKTQYQVDFDVIYSSDNTDVPVGKLYITDTSENSSGQIPPYIDFYNGKGIFNVPMGSNISLIAKDMLLNESGSQDIRVEKDLLRSEGNQLKFTVDRRNRSQSSAFNFFIKSNQVHQKSLNYIHRAQSSFVSHASAAETKGCGVILISVRSLEGMGITNAKVVLKDDNGKIVGTKTTSKFRQTIKVQGKDTIIVPGQVAFTGVPVPINPSDLNQLARYTFKLESTIEGATMVSYEKPVSDTVKDAGSVSLSLLNQTGTGDIIAQGDFAQLTIAAIKENSNEIIEGFPAYVSTYTSSPNNNCQNQSIPSVWDPISADKIEGLTRFTRLIPTSRYVCVALDLRKFIDLKAALEGNLNGDTLEYELKDVESQASNPYLIWAHEDFEYVNSHVVRLKKPIIITKDKLLDIRFIVKPIQRFASVTVVNNQTGKQLKDFFVFAKVTTATTSTDYCMGENGTKWKADLLTGEGGEGLTNDVTPLKIALTSDTSTYCIMLGGPGSEVRNVAGKISYILGDANGKKWEVVGDTPSRKVTSEPNPIITFRVVPYVASVVTPTPTPKPVGKLNPPPKSPGISRKTTGVSLSGSGVTALGPRPKTLIPRVLAAGTLQKLYFYRSTDWVKGTYAKIGELNKTGSNVSYSFTDTSLRDTSNGIYCYYVTVVGRDTSNQPAESDPSLKNCINMANNVVGSDPTKLNIVITVKAPTNLSTALRGDGEQIDIAWKNTNSITGFDGTIIERSNNRDFDTITSFSVGNTAEGYGDRAISLGEIYYYRIYAYKNTNDGVQVISSTTASVQQNMPSLESAELVPPQIVSAKFKPNGKLSLKVKDKMPRSNNQESAFEVWVKKSTDTNATRLGDLPRSAIVTGDFTSPGCTVSVNNNCYWASGTYQVYVRGIGKTINGNDARSTKSSIVSVTN